MTNTKAARVLERMLTCKSTASTLRAILFSRERPDVWDGLVAVPTKPTFLSRVLAEFREHTPVALELVMMAVITLVAQFLAEKGAGLMLRDGQRVRLDLYTVLLAASGQLKSFSISKIQKAIAPLWEPKLISDPGSTAGLLADLAENDGKPLFLRIEEFGEFMACMKSEIHAGTPRLLLMAYDGAKITKRLKDEEIVIESPYLSMLGTTVGENLWHQLSEADWRSGLCQRLAFIICREDPTRDWRDRKYALLDTLNLESIRDAFAKLITTPVHSEYILTPDALTQIRDCWELMGVQGIDHDFVRRVEFRSFKYAVVYHYLLGKSSPEIDAEDINWATRLALLHLHDLKAILSSTEYKEYEELMRKGEAIRRLMGEKFAPRDLQMRLHHRLRNCDEAKSLYLLVLQAAVKNGEKNLPSRERIEELTGQRPMWL